MIRFVDWFKPREKCPSGPAGWLVLHDVSPATFEAFQEFFVEIGGWDAAVTLLVVPFSGESKQRDRAELAIPVSFPVHGALPVEWLAGLRLDRCEVAVHGFRHRREGTPGWLERLWTLDAECRTLSVDAFAPRWLAAADLWRRAGCDAAGFVAPGWWLPRELQPVLRAGGARYTTRVSGFVDLASGRFWKVPTLCFSTRSALRRRLSLWYNRALLRWSRNHPLRFGLHPDDLTHPEVRAFWRVALRDERGRRCWWRKLDALAIWPTALDEGAGTAAAATGTVHRDAGETGNGGVTPPIRLPADRRSC